MTAVSDWRPKGAEWATDYAFTRADIMFARTCRALPPPPRPPDRNPPETDDEMT